MNIETSGRQGVETPSEGAEFAIPQAHERYSDQKVATKELAAIALKGCILSSALAEVDRVPRRKSGKRENDAEHSLMLAIVAPNLSRIIRPDLDKDKIRLYAMVHDMLEIETGDVATFNATPQELAEKERREHAAMERLLPKLMSIEAEALTPYEKQEDEESRFVRMVDKLLPVALDITGQGVRVVREDYGIDSLSALKEAHEKSISKLEDMFGEEFPELIEIYIELTEMFQQKYSEEAIETTTLQPPAPTA